MNTPLQHLVARLRLVPLLLAAGAFVAVGTATTLVSTPAAAQEAEVLHFCYTPAGTVYRIKAEGLREDCSAPSHTEFTVKPEGEQGPPGEQGEPGTALAYARVQALPAPDLTVRFVGEHPGFTEVRRISSTGIYCLKAEPDISVDRLYAAVVSNASVQSTAAHFIVSAGQSAVCDSDELAVNTRTSAGDLVTFVNFNVIVP